MKKTTVIAVIIASIGVYTGGSWYIGKQLENGFQQRVEQVNKLLSSSFTPMFDLELTNANIERGIFSSEIKYNLHINIDGESQSYDIPFTGKVYHGPITLNNFSFNLLSGTTYVAENEQTKKWFKNEKNNPLKMDFSVCYLQNMQGKIESDFVAKLEQIEGEFNFIQHFEIDKNNVAKFEIDMPLAKLTFKQNSNGNEHVIPNYDMTLVNTKGKSSFSFNQNLSHTWLNEAYVKTEYGSLISGNSIIEYENHDLHFIAKENEQEKDFIDIIIDNYVDEVNLNNLDLGKVKIKLGLKHLDGESVNQLVAEYKKYGKNQIDNQVVKYAVEKILQNTPHFVLQPLVVENGKGMLESNISAELLKDFLKLPNIQHNLFQIFTHFNFDLQLDHEALVEFLTAYEVSKGKSREKANAQVRKNLAMYQTSIGIFDKERNKYQINLKFENNQLYFNQQRISNEDIKMGVFLLGMLLSSYH